MSLRPVKPIPLVGVELAEIKSKPPVFEWVDPKLLQVEASYQRNLSAKSITLIRRIAAAFDWAHLKPPVCARASDGKLFCIDGQHSAIAAASRGVEEIPVMVVEAADVRRRAKAFVSHNTDRLNITPLQMFASRLAAEDPGALAAQRAAKAAGVTILRSQPANGHWSLGETMACGAVERLVAKYGEERGTRALKTLIAAKRAPVAAHEILAVSAVLFDPKFGWRHSTFDLVTVIRSKSIDGWHRPVVARMKTAAGGNRTAVWKGVAEAWVRAGDRADA
jgi:ParB-like nuclease domain